MVGAISDRNIPYGSTRTSLETDPDAVEDGSGPEPDAEQEGAAELISNIDVAR